MIMNYISLGYFCSVAMELEKYGIRTESSPFDWVISEFEGVIAAIKQHFDGYLTAENLSQAKNRHHIYKNEKYNISFYHDFDKYVPLERQLPELQAKYTRRINRFYESIKKPTLFIRYISEKRDSEGKVEEVVWIENNYKEIMSLLKSFNEYNEILFIANEGVSSELFKIYNVPKDKNDTVARDPFCKNPVLFEKFTNIDFPNKEENIARYKKKYGAASKLRNKIKSAVKKIFLKEYVHTKQH